MFSFRRADLKLQRLTGHQFRLRPVDACRLADKPTP
jgi:hypothetical protein